jgi:low affinity Fe/Cu permease
MNEAFRKFAQAVSHMAGTSWAFIGAALVIVVWAATGPIFQYSDTWQLVINTGTTIITFLMVFLIQNTQNRDAKAIHLKLDELIKGVGGARTGLVDLENMSDEELEKLHKEFEDLHQEVDSRLNKSHDKKKSSRSE